MRTDIVASFAVVLLTFAAQACGGAQQAEPESPEDPGAPKTLVDDEAERKQLKADLKAAIDDVDREMKDLGDRIEEATEDTRERLELERKKLQERRDALANALRRLNDTANETGREVREEIQGLMRDLGLRAGEPEK